MVPRRVAWVVWLVLALLASCGGGEGPAEGGPREDQSPTELPRDVALPDAPVGDGALDAPRDGAPQDSSPPAMDASPEADAAAQDGTSPDALDAPGADAPSGEAAAPDLPPSDVSMMDRPPMDAPEPMDTTSTEDTSSPRPDRPTGDLGPSRGAPTLVILSPTPRAMVRDTIELVLRIDVPDGLGALEASIDGVVRARVINLEPELSLDTDGLTAGRHTLTLRLSDARGATAMASVEVVVTDPVVVGVDSVTPSRASFRNGEALELTLETRGPARVTGDFSALDTGWDPSRVTVTDLGGGRVALRYPISATNAREDGLHRALLRVEDRGRPGSALEVPVPLRLENVPPVGFSLDGDVFLRDPAPAVASTGAGDPLAITAASVAGPLVRERDVALSIAWSAAPESPVVSLRLREEGTAGTRVLPLRAGTTRADVTLREAPGVALTTGLHRLTLQVVDARGVASAPRTVAVLVEPLAVGGPMAPMVVVGGVYFTKRVAVDTVACRYLGAARTTVVFPLEAPAQVRLIQVLDSAVLARGTVGAGGAFRLSASVPRGVLVRVDLETTIGSPPDLRVVNRLDFAHVHRGTPFASASGVTAQDVRVPVTSAGSINLLDVVWSARAFAISNIPTTVAMPPLTVRWEAGWSNECSTSCYSPAAGARPHRLLIQGLPGDPDEWDDLVVRHEYGHFVHEVFSRSSNPGGEHSSTTQVTPPLAYGEGFATFWGNLSANSNCYWDVTGRGGGARRIDVIGRIPVGTSPPDTHLGDLSEGAVTAILWTIAHAPAFSVAGRPALEGLNHAFFNYLPGVPDRAPAGADLNDALDGWLCARSCLEASMRRYAVGTWEFAYENPERFVACLSPFRDSDLGVTGRRCVGEGTLVLQRTGLARFLLSSGRISRQFMAGAPDGVVPLPNSAGDVAVVRPLSGNPTRAVVSNLSEGTASVINLQRGVEAEVDIDNNPSTRFPPSAPPGINRFDIGMGTGGTRGVAVTPDGRFALLAHGSATRNELVVLDLDKLTVCRRIPIPARATGPAIPTDVVIPRRAPILCRRAPPPDAGADAGPPPPAPPERGRAYVSLAGLDATPGDAVAVIDLDEVTFCRGAGGGIIRYLTLPGGSIGPRSLSLSPDGTRLAVAGYNLSRSYVIDPCDGSVAFDVGTAGGTNPFGVGWSPSGSAVFWCNRTGITGSPFSFNGTLWGLWPGIGGLRGWLATERNCRAFTFGTDGAWLYAGDENGRLTAIPVPTPAGMGPSTVYPGGPSLPFLGGSILRLVNL
ncbi:MAG: hypothetical protein HY909_15410 [Deltaproteobacteria bacterium]|nr:hypothetical protein [Deltaproteobacteria bacterium]